MSAPPALQINPLNQPACSPLPPHPQGLQPSPRSGPPAPHSPAGAPTTGGPARRRGIEARALGVSALQRKQCLCAPACPVHAVVPCSSPQGSWPCSYPATGEGLGFIFRQGWGVRLETEQPRELSRDVLLSRRRGPGLTLSQPRAVPVPVPAGSGCLRRWDRPLEPGNCGTGPAARTPSLREQGLCSWKDPQGSLGRHLQPPGLTTPSPGHPQPQPSAAPPAPQGPSWNQAFSLSALRPSALCLPQLLSPSASLSPLSPQLSQPLSPSAPSTPFSPSALTLLQPVSPFSSSAPQPLQPLSPEPAQLSAPQPSVISTPQPLSPQLPQPFSPSALSPQPLSPSTPRPLSSLSPSAPSAPQPLSPLSPSAPSVPQPSAPKPLSP